MIDLAIRWEQQLKQYAQGLEHRQLRGEQQTNGNRWCGAHFQSGNYKPYKCIRLINTTYGYVDRKSAG